MTRNTETSRPADLEDKSAESLVSDTQTLAPVEVAAADVAAPATPVEALPDAPEVAEVELLHHWTDDDGVAWLPGQRLTIPARRAADLVGAYRAFFTA